MYKGAATGSVWTDTVLQSTMCSTPTPTQCTENGQTYSADQIFGDFVQERKVSGDGYECKRKKCVGGVIIPWPTPNDPGCPPVARQVQTTTATIVVTGPGDSTPQAAAGDLVDKVTGDHNDPGRVVVITTVPIAAPTTQPRCPWESSSRPEGFQYRIRSGDADQHCIDRICRGGVWLGVPSPTGATCTSTADVTPFPNNPQARDFTLLTTTKNFLVTLSLVSQEDVARLQALFGDTNSALYQGTYTTQSLTLTAQTLTYTCSNGVAVTDSSQCDTAGALHLTPSLVSLVLLTLGFLFAF